MGFIEIILIVLGWFALKFGILNHTSFETSFLAGIVYNYTALIVIAIVVFIWKLERTLYSDFIDVLQSKVITYSVLASLSITVCIIIHSGYQCYDLKRLSTEAECI